MNIKIPFALIVLLVSGCSTLSTLDRGVMSSFELLPTEKGKNKFYFVAETASVSYPDNDKGEAVRMGWLEYYIELNEICQSGYNITSRQATNIAKSIKEPQKKIVYYGECPKT